MLAYAQELVYNLKELMPTQYQKDNFDAMLGLFLSAQGYPLPEHSKTKSPSALSGNINPCNQDMIADCSQLCIIAAGFTGFIMYQQRPSTTFLHRRYHSTYLLLKANASGKFKSESLTRTTRASSAHVQRMM
jgi:hypothetical protein